MRQSFEYHDTGLQCVNLVSEVGNQTPKILDLGNDVGFMDCIVSFGWIRDSGNYMIIHLQIF